MDYKNIKTPFTYLSKIIKILDPIFTSLSKINYT